VRGCEEGLVEKGSPRSPPKRFSQKRPTAYKAVGRFVTASTDFSLSEAEYNDARRQAMSPKE